MAPLAVAVAVFDLAPSPARACSLAIPELFAPYENPGPVPQNFRFFSWRQLGGDGGYQLTTATGKGVPLRREHRGGRVDTMPRQPVAPGRYRFRSDAMDEISITVRRGMDHSPPKLLRVDPPRKVHYPPMGTCGATVDTSIGILASDDSPLIFAVWGSRSGEPDLAVAPVMYTMSQGNTLELWHARQELGLEPGEGSWAIMAIDAAGNVSDVVSTPSQQRLPGIIFAEASPEVPRAANVPDAGAPPEEEAAPTHIVKLSRQAKSHGCGCDVPGQGPALAPAWLLPVGALLAIRLRRRRSANARPRHIRVEVPAQTP